MGLHDLRLGDRFSNVTSHNGTTTNGKDQGSLWSGIPDCSTRRLTRRRMLTYRLSAPIFNAASVATVKSWRVRTSATPAAMRALEGEQPVIPCFWHRRSFASIPYLLQTAQGGRRYCLLVSPSVDGELVAQVARYWDVDVVRGSATRTGGKAIRNLYRRLSKDGSSPLIAPDGPHGPAHEAKPGAVMLAQLSGAPILPMAFATDRPWTLKSWDRLLIPQPFSKVTMSLGDPIEVPRDLPASLIEHQTACLGSQLDKLVSEAEAALAGWNRPARPRHELSHEGFDPSGRGLDRS